MKIFTIHLLNDYIDNTKIVRQLIKGWIKNNLEIVLLTNQNKTGFLSNLDSDFKLIWYKLDSNKFVVLINLLISQFIVFFKILKFAKKEDLIYINTILPFGAAIAGKLKGCRIIYHIYETSIKPTLFKKFVFSIAKATATEVIYVSNFIAKQELIKIKSHILHNAVEEEFLKKAIKNRNSHSSINNVLMVCSLKKYKGVFEFIELAKENKEYRFKLVLNASKDEIKRFFKNTTIPNNCTLVKSQTDLHSFYKWADVILNLSKPKEWIEAVGLTIIEGMAYGLPAIIPPIGGITELVEENHNGFIANSTNFNELNNALNKLMINNEIYHMMSIYATEKIHDFREASLVNKSLDIIKQYA